MTIGGNIGAGKTALAAKLAPAMGYEKLDVGDIFRAMGAELGMSIHEFYAFIKNDPAIERKVDERQIRLMNEKNDFIVQGRIAWYFAKKSPSVAINILLTVSPRIGAERKMKQEKNAEKSIEKILALCEGRERNERDHYRSLYGILNHLDPAHYDIILDTSSLDENEVFQKILAEIRGKIARMSIGELAPRDSALARKGSSL